MKLSKKKIVDFEFAFSFISFFYFYFLSHFASNFLGSKHNLNSLCRRVYLLLLLSFSMLFLEIN